MHCIQQCGSPTDFPETPLPSRDCGYGQLRPISINSHKIHYLLDISTTGSCDQRHDPFREALPFTCTLLTFS